MPGFPRPFATEDADDGTFDEYDEFVPDHLPEPGSFLEETTVLTGDEHVAFHEVSREVFEERGVYDATFGYNLARLNLDTRHSDAGFRYGISPDDEDVLLAEFTPTTEFCPQAGTLTVGAFRAWNGLSDRHDYDRVSVAVAESHHQSEAVNERLRDMERQLQEGEDVEDIVGGSEATNVPPGMGERPDDGDDPDPPL